MKNLRAILLIVLIALVFTAVPATAQPSISELDKCESKMSDLSELNTLVQSSQTKDDIGAAIAITNIAGDFNTHIAYLKSLLEIMEMVKNTSDRKFAMRIIDSHIKYVATIIDSETKLVNALISSTKNSNIVSIGNQLKAELRNLKKILSH